MLQILFAILAGVLTIGAPCILPLLPILLGTSVGQTSKSRPFYIVAGFVVVFAALGVSLSFLTSRLGLNPNTLRFFAIVMLAIFGALLIWPKPLEMLTRRLNGFINRANTMGKARNDNLGGFILGMTLGIIWTPCAGPVLGAILTLVAAQQNLARSLVLLLAYAIGAGIPMLVIAYGSQWVTTKVRAIAKYSLRLQQIFGVLIILLAGAMYFNFDVQLQTKLANFFPKINLEQKLTQANSSKDMPKIDFKNYGPAPDFIGISKWLNSDPLTINSLKGKVVLVDFWTYSCINCIRTLPYVTKWYDTYRDKGLVVVGVHTPEFEFEKNTDNVTDAIRRFKINYPVAQDNNFATWNNYSNSYWPAEYLINKDGQIVYTHFGEGNYDHTENAIRTLLNLDMQQEASTNSVLSGVGSPEMYFGTNRLQYLSPDQTASSAGANYTLPANLSLNKFALEGFWKFSPDGVTLLKPQAKIKLKFHAAKVHIVAKSSQPQKIKISVDGRPQPDVLVGVSKLYTLFDSKEYNDHVIEISIPGNNFEAFTFTFG